MLFRLKIQIQNAFYEIKCKMFKGKRNFLYLISLNESDNVLRQVYTLNKFP